MKNKFLSLDYSTIIFFIKYCIVGAVGMVLDFSIIYLGKEKLKINALLVNAIGFIVAIVHSFCVNKLWTFDDHSVYCFFDTRVLHQ